jgi:hypothetical protein
MKYTVPRLGLQFGPPAVELGNSGRNPAALFQRLPLNSDGVLVTAMGLS